jgi:hypothetical protein
MMRLTALPKLARSSPDRIMDHVRKRNPPQPVDDLDPGEKLTKQLCAIITHVCFSLRANGVRLP